MSLAVNGHKPKVISARPSSGTRVKKLRARRRPAWDSTVNDLSVHKASPEELDRRKLVHLSQNMDLVKDDKLRKRIARAQHQSRREQIADQEQKIALLKELLCDDSQLQETLQFSDKLISSVRNMVDPKKFSGVPHVTKAPNHMQSDRSLPPDGTRLRVPSDLDTLSSSVMDRSALNDFDDDYSTSDSAGEDLHESYQPVTDFTRFKQLIQEAEREKLQEQGTRRTTETSQRKTNLKPPEQVERKPPENTPVSSPQAQQAINNTERVRRTRAFTDHGTSIASNPGTSVAGNQAITTTYNTPTMDDFNKMLEDVQTNLREYERMTGRVASTRGSAPSSFSGYTMALLDAVSRMSIYFRESQVRAQTESGVREMLTRDVDRLNGLVDALSTDIIATQEEYARLQNEFVKHRREAENQLLLIRQALAMNGIVVPIVRQQAVPNTAVASQQTNMAATASALSASQPSWPPAAIPSHHAVQSDLSSDHAVQPAILLSEPKQMDSPVGAPGQRPYLVRNLDSVRSALKFDVAPDRLQTLINRQQQEQNQNPESHQQQQNPEPHLSQRQHPDPLQLDQKDSYVLQSNLNSRHENKILLDTREQYERLPGPLGQGYRDINKGNQLVGPVGNHPDPRVVESRDGGNDGQSDIKRQLTELNRQRLAAQTKLQELIQRQQTETNQKSVVSPAISPITCESEYDSLPTATNIASKPKVDPTQLLVQSQPKVNPTQTSVQGGQTRQIHVRVPQAGEGDSAAGLAEIQAESVKNQNVPRMNNLLAMNGNRPTSYKTGRPNPQGSGDDGWFSLAANVAS